MSLIVFGLALSAHASNGTSPCLAQDTSWRALAKEVSRAEVARTVKRMWGVDFARIIRSTSWNDLWWAGLQPEVPTLVLQNAKNKKVALPVLKFAVVAPAPLKIEVELRFESFKDGCVPIQIPAFFERSWPREGSLTVEAHMTVVTTMSVAGLSQSWGESAEKAELSWGVEDNGRRYLELNAERAVPLVIAGQKGDVAKTLAILRHDNALLGWDRLLLLSLNEPGSHRAPALELLAQLGFRDLPGEAWVHLRQLQDGGKLSRAEAEQIGWWTRPLEAAEESDAATITAANVKAPPRLFVGGREVTGWQNVGEEKFEIRVLYQGLAPVKVEFARDSSQSFVTVLSKGVHLLVRPEFGTSVESWVPGWQCGLVKGKAKILCGHGDDRGAPVDKVFNLRRQCNGMPAYMGEVVWYGVDLVPTAPGTYVWENDRHLSWDPTYAGKGEAPASCAVP